jgi:hypothetical protein
VRDGEAWFFNNFVSGPEKPGKDMVLHAIESGRSELPFGKQHVRRFSDGKFGLMGRDAGAEARSQKYFLLPKSEYVPRDGHIWAICQLGSSDQRSSDQRKGICKMLAEIIQCEEEQIRSYIFSPESSIKGKCEIRCCSVDVVLRS